jgi:hypothetical protein
MEMDNTDGKMGESIEENGKMGKSKENNNKSLMKRRDEIFYLIY